MKLLQKIKLAKNIPDLIKDKDFVIVGGNGGTGAPEKILVEIEKSFIASNKPKNLTIFHITGIGAVDKYGLNRLNHTGLVSKVIGGNFGLQIPFMKNLMNPSGKRQLISYTNKSQLLNSFYIMKKVKPS